MPNGGVRIRRVVELVVAAAIGAILQNMAMSFLSAPRHFVGGDGLLPYRSNREPPYIPCKYQSALLFLAGSAACLVSVAFMLRTCRRQRAVDGHVVVGPTLAPHRRCWTCSLYGALVHCIDLVSSDATPYP